MTPSPPTTRTQAHTPQQRALLRQLESAPESAALVAAVEWLWRLFPEASDRPHDRRVQLRHSTDLAFDAREIASVEYDAAPPTAAVLTASFFGLAGAATMLPHYLAEEADADDDRAAAIRGLLDIIHHRLLTHLVRGLHAVDLARTLRADGADPWSRRILDFLGHDDSDTIPPALALRLAPALAAGVRTPALLTAALRILLENHLGAAHLHVEAFSGGWMPIDAPQWSTFGAPTARLGDTAVLGTEVFYPAGAARIVIGPLRGDEYRKFTPGHLPHARIAQFTRQFSPDPIQFDLILDIEDLALPPGILGQRSLGEDLWLARSDHRGVKDRKTIPLA
jgi:type VI secretion system protein ImpH